MALAALFRLALRFFLEHTLTTGGQHDTGPALGVNQGITFDDQLSLSMRLERFLDLVPLLQGDEHGPGGRTIRRWRG